MSYTNTFGAQPVAPANPSFLALSIAANAALVWPLETTEGSPYVASLMDVTAGAAGLELMMPPGNTGSTGVVAIVANVGANSFTLTDQSDDAIAVIATTQAWIIALTDNTTANGTWVAYQLASTTSSASAASLAGLGLQALGSLLQTKWNTAQTASNILITSSYRSTLLIWTSAVGGGWSLDTIANLTPGWFFGYANQGSQVVTISTTDGSTINGQPNLPVLPGDNGIIVCSAGGFNSFAGLNGILEISQGGTGAADAPAALTNLGASTIGASIFTAPSAAAVVALLGLNNFTFQESTIATSQTLAAGSTNTIFVATTALTIMPPLTTTVTPQWVFGVYAYGGAVTIAPQATDFVNGGGEGASWTLPQGGSALFVTDAAGHLWPIFLSQPIVGRWAIAGGTADAITATYTPPNAGLIDGMLLGFRASAANQTTAPTFAPDGLTAEPITYSGGLAVQPGVIPAALAECLVRYNAANTRWELLNPSGAPAELILNVAGSSNVTLTAAQAAYPILTFTGALTGSITVFVPAAVDKWIVHNNTSGAYTISVQPTGGSTSQQIMQGHDRSIWTDGTNTFSQADDPSVYPGMLINVQVFDTSGTATYTPTAGTGFVEVEVIGDGGGSGGTALTGASQVAVAGGAGGGGYARGIIASGFAGVTVTVGPGGAAGAAGGAGGNGTGSSFGSLITATGGIASNPGSAVSGTGITLSAPGAGGIGASGSETNNYGGSGGVGIVTQGAGFGGAGGSAGNGAPGPGPVASGAGAAGSNRGAGAAGACQPTASSAALAGAAGALGQVIVREYSGTYP
jgi:hypothetical protein